MLKDIEARHSDIVKLEQSLKELCDLFNDLALLVSNQVCTDAYSMNDLARPVSNQVCTDAYSMIIKRCESVTIVTSYVAILI